MAKMLVCGVVNWDVTLFVDRLPGPGQEVNVNNIISVPGGKGGNTAVAGAKILGPGQVGLLAMLGSDEVASRQMDFLAKDGVDTTCVLQQDVVGSGQAHIAVDSKGENMILTFKAANQMLTAEILNTDKVRSSLEQSDLLVIIDPPLQVAGVLTEYGKKNGKTVVWSPALLTTLGFSALEEHMQNSDYLILNEHEAMQLAGMDDGRKSCAELSNRLAGKKVITTLGSQGCLVCVDGKTALIPAMDLAAFGLETISTVGAGDAFVGAFAAFKLQSKGDFESLFLASIAAAIKTTRKETRASPDLKEILHYASDTRLADSWKKIRFS